MKKISLLVCALGASMLLSANVTENVLNKEVPVQLLQAQKIEKNKEGGEMRFVEKIGRKANVDAIQKAIAAAEYDGVEFYYTPGMMPVGPLENGATYNASFLTVPYAATTVWHSAYDGTPNWYVNGNLMAEASSTMEFSYWFNGWYYMPETDDYELVRGSNTYSIKGFTYGEGTSDQILVAAPGYRHTFGVNEDFELNVTNCAMQTSTLFEEDGRDYWWVGPRKNSGCTGNFLIGTGLQTADGVRVDTMGFTIENLGYMEIHRILIPYITGGEENLKRYFPEDAEVALKIYPIVDGVVRTDVEPLAETVIKQENVHPNSTFPSQGVMIVNFYKKNALGVLSEYYPLIEGDFYLEMTGYNEGNCQFGILSDYYCPITYTTYYTINGKFTDLWGDGGQNAAVTFDAYCPGFVDARADEVLLFPMEGGRCYYESDVTREQYPGYSLVEVGSNIDQAYLLDEESGVLALAWPEDFVEFEGFDDEYYEEESVLVFLFSASANDGYDREGEIEVYLDDEDMPISTTVKFFQPGKLGPQPEGINNVAATTVKAEKMMKNGQLLIKMGDNIFNAMGQQVK